MRDLNTVLTKRGDFWNYTAAQPNGVHVRQVATKLEFESDQV